MNKDLIRNIKIHNKIANEYDKLHVEIFNQKEQGRLHKELSICNLICAVFLLFYVIEKFLIQN